MDWLEDCECDGVIVVLGVEVLELDDDWLGEEVAERLCVKVALSDWLADCDWLRD